MAGLIDCERMIAKFDEWPEITPFASAQVKPRMTGIKTAITTARFIDWVEGRNR